MASEALAAPGSPTLEDAKLNHLVAAQLCKTKMCAMFTRGQCRDESCRFAHSRTELRSAPDLSKTAMCRAFARGRCVDPACRFAHGEEELRVTPTVYKTQLCNFFDRGRCKKGNRCRHAHGATELRSFEASPSPASAPPTPTTLMSPPGFRTPSGYMNGGFICTPEPMKVLLPTIPHLPMPGMEPLTPPRPLSAPPAGPWDQDAQWRLTFAEEKETQAKDTVAPGLAPGSLATQEALWQPKNALVATQEALWRPDQIKTSQFSLWVV